MEPIEKTAPNGIKYLCWDQGTELVVIFLHGTGGFAPHGTSGVFKYINEGLCGWARQNTPPYTILAPEGVRSANGNPYFYNNIEKEFIQYAYGKYGQVLFVTGNSQGGMSTWNILQKDVNKLVSFFGVCMGKHGVQSAQAMIDNWKNTSAKGFSAHGENDGLVQYNGGKKTTEIYNEVSGNLCDWYSLPDKGHNITGDVYNSGGIFHQWIAENVLNTPPVDPPTPDPTPEDIAYNQAIDDAIEQLNSLRK